MNLIDYEERMQDIESDYDEMIFRFAQEVFEAIVIPFCDKYNLSFVSGMGTYVFDNGNSIHAYWRMDKRKEELLKILDILDIPSLTGSPLGSYMSDYTSNKEN